MSTRALLRGAPPPDAASAERAAPAPRLLRVWRYLRLALHLAEGVATIALLHRFSSRTRREAMRRSWSARLLRVLGIQLEQRGETVAPGCMLVANHVSWVDIFVINALAPAAFVSKAEVRDWPVIGWLAARNNTIFLRRGSRGHARIINEETAALLDAGRNVAIFPEGTTSDGCSVLQFSCGLAAAGNRLRPPAADARAAVPQRGRSLQPRCGLRWRSQPRTMSGEHRRRTQHRRPRHRGSALGHHRRSRSARPGRPRARADRRRDRRAATRAGPIRPQPGT